VTVWLIPSTGQKIPVQPGWCLPQGKIPLDENRFLQAGKGPENTKKKSRQCFAFEGGENTLHTILVVVDRGRSPHTSVGGSTLKKSHIITYSSSSLSNKKLMDFHMQKGSELSFLKSPFVCI
jgi:hypothetical protein